MANRNKWYLYQLTEEEKTFLNKSLDGQKVFSLYLLCNKRHTEEEKTKILASVSAGILVVGILSCINVPRWTSFAFGSVTASILFFILRLFYDSSDHKEIRDATLMIRGLSLREGNSDLGKFVAEMLKY